MNDELIDYGDGDPLESALLNVAQYSDRGNPKGMRAQIRAILAATLPQAAAAQPGDAMEAALRHIAARGEPVCWQWRRKGEPWTLERTFNSEVFATTPDSEVRPLYASLPPAVRLSDSEIQAVVFAVLRKWKDDRAWDRYTRESGPYDVTSLRAEVLEIIRAVLAASPAPSAPAEPAQRAGWRWVPVEPTEAMQDAACDDIGLCAEDRADDEIRQEYRVAYRAMLAAAPAPEGVPQNTEGVPASDATEAAYQRGKRAGYSEGFLAGRDGVAPSPEGFGNMDLTPPAPGQKRPAVTIRLTRDPATGEVLRADDPGVSLADADTFAPSHADAPKEPR